MLLYSIMLSYLSCFPFIFLASICMLICYRSSLLQDDVLPLQSLYIDMPSDSDSMNKMMDFQSDSCDTDGVGSLKGFNNPNFSYSHGSVNGHAHPDKLNSRHNSGQTCGPSSIKVRLLSKLLLTVYVNIVLLRRECVVIMRGGNTEGGNCYPHLG